MKKANKKFHYLSIQQTVRAFFLFFILMALSMRRAESLRVYSGAGITNRESGGISYHGVSTSTPALPAPNYGVGTELVSSSLPRTIGDVVVVSDGPIVNEGTVSTSAGSLTLASRVGVEQNRLALATEHVQIITPGAVSFGSGSVTGVLQSSDAISDGQTNTQPAIQVIASAITGVGCTMGDLSATPVRSIELVSTQGGIEFSTEYVTTYRSKKTLLGGKKSSTEVQVIPPVFRGPLLLSSATFARFTAAQFLAPVEYTSYLNAREDITLQGAIASRSEMSSQLLGRASSYSEQLVPTFATHGLCVHTSGAQSITLQGFIPTRQLTLSAPSGELLISAMPLHSYAKKTGLGVGIEASAFMGMVQSQADLTPYLLGERKAPKVKIAFSAPFQSYAQQWQNPDQPDWAKAVNAYAAGKEAYGLYQFLQNPQKQALLHVGGRLSYSSYEEQQLTYAATEYLLEHFAAEAISIRVNGVSIRSEVVDIRAEILKFAAEMAYSAYSFDSISASLSLAITPGVPQLPLTGSAAVTHWSGYSQYWIPAELLTPHLRLTVNELTIINRGRVVAATGLLVYQHASLSEQQNHYSAQGYSASLSSGGALRASFTHEGRHWTPYHSEITLLDRQITVQSGGTPDSADKQFLALDLSFISDALSYFRETSSKSRPRHDNPVVTQAMHAPAKTTQVSVKKSTKPAAGIPDVKEATERSSAVAVSTAPKSIMERPRSYLDYTALANSRPLPYLAYANMMSSPSARMAPAEPKDYSDAVIRGVLKGLSDLATMLKHPLDHVVYPIGSLVCDTVVCLSVSEMDEREQDALIPLRPGALTRMRDRWEGLKKIAHTFEAATPLQRAEQLSELLTTLAVPGQALKLGGRLGQTASRFHRFHLLKEPPRFQTRQWWDIPPVPSKAITVSASELQAMSRSTDLMYVILADGTLHIARERLATAVFSRDSMVKSKLLAHPDLAQFQPAVAAGMVYVKNGRILEINDISGHFRPHGAHLPRLVERCFERYRLPVEGVYRSRFPTPATKPGHPFTLVLKPLDEMVSSSEVFAGTPFLVTQFRHPDTQEEHSQSALSTFGFFSLTTANHDSLEEKERDISSLEY